MEPPGERFTVWMDGMDVLLAEFLAGLPADIAGRLDYSIESLDVLEAWLLDKYASSKAMLDDPDVAAWDAAARYLGQVFVRHLNGEWIEDHNTGRPNVLVDGGPWHDVMLLVSSTPHRRTGNRLRTLAERNLEVIESGGFGKYFKERGIL